MENFFEGALQYANGQPLPGARVRLFDKDTFGQDDDLTVLEGLTGKDGRFSLTYDPSRDLDFADIYLPYLRFEYTLNGQAKVHYAFIQPFIEAYRTEDIPPTTFTPSVHGFQFVNRFPGYWIPFSIPSIPDIPSVSNIYGLCGGMCAASLDFLLAGRPIPNRTRVPGRARPLHQYLHQRQVDSLTGGSQVVRFARWMALPDDAVRQRSVQQFEQLRQQLDNKIPTPIGLVYTSTRDTLQIWTNHQVLAVDYKIEGDTITIQLYEPNRPKRDDITIVSTPDGAGGFNSHQTMGRTNKHVRGFFVMPYTPVTPPAELTEES